MHYKITGLVRNGRWDNVKEEWELARITPRFFPRYQEAKTFFGREIHTGTMWRENEDGARNRYSVIETVGKAWPKGARAGPLNNHRENSTPLNHQESKHSCEKCGCYILPEKSRQWVKYCDCTVIGIDGLRRLRHPREGMR